MNSQNNRRGIKVNVQQFKFKKGKSVFLYVHCHNKMRCETFFIFWIALTICRLTLIHAPFFLRSSCVFLHSLFDLQRVSIYIKELQSLAGANFCNAIPLCNLGQNVYFTKTLYAILVLKRVHL